jgi:PKD repeat protein
LRMTRDGWAPPDNPFVDDPEWFNLTYTYGHRNMFGLAFHPFTDRAYVTENGPECNDEVSLLTEGENFGWGPNYTCSTPPPPPNNTNQDGPNPVLPIWWWGRTICPTNAAVYRGSLFPDWQGDLFMGDCNFGTLHRLRLAPPNYETVESDTPIWTSPNDIFDVEVGPDGAIWLTTWDAIYRFSDSTKWPVASFTANPNPVVVGDPVAFNASGSRDDGTIVSYAWNFGDGTSATGETASHIYTSLGTYNVSLAVTDNESFIGTAYVDILVIEAPPPPVPPVAAFTANPNRVVVGQPVEFDASSSHDPDGTILSYAWDFDDGTTASGRIVFHSYGSIGTYNVSLTVTDNDSLTDTAFEDVVVSASIPGRPPVAVFTVSPSPAATEEPVTFDASGSSDPDGGIVSYEWDFGDSDGGEGNLTTHEYESPATYLIRLTVRDNQNLSANSMQTLVVTDRPRPVISHSPTTIFIGTAVSFDATGSVDPDGTIEAWTWNFGDDSEDMGPQVTYLYLQKGSFTVTLTVQDNEGLTNSTSRPIEVVNRAPRIESSTPGGASVTVVAGADHTFNVSATDPDGDPLAYVWRIDDMAAGGNSPSLNFRESDPGTYVVDVTVSDGDESVSREWTVTVPQPVRALGWADLWPTATLLAAIAGATGFVAWRRYRKRRKEPLQP